MRELIDADALRRALTALAKETGDPGTLRKAGLVLIKDAFLKGRERVRYAVEKEGLPGLAAARALSALQDAIIQVIYDFATKHVYYAQNPSSAERIAVVATGGYGRGELAPGSDIDLLFLRPFKQTAWGESVIEFILYMLWDLGLKVGHATRSRWPKACAWPSRTSPSAPPSWRRAICGATRACTTSCARNSGPRSPPAMAATLSKPS